MMEFLKDMGTAARAGLIAAACIVVLGMAAALWWVLSPDYQLLFGDLREQDAAEITKSLAEWKVPYRVTTGGKGIEAAAEEAGLPMLDLVFFTPEQLETMREGQVNEAQQARVDIWNKTKAAAGA